MTAKNDRRGYQRSVGSCRNLKNHTRAYFRAVLIFGAKLLVGGIIAYLVSFLVANTIKMIRYSIESERLKASILKLTSIKTIDTTAVEIKKPKKSSNKKRKYNSDL